MTVLSITTSQVQPGSESTDGAVFENGIAGVNITAGQVVYYDTTNQVYKLAQSDGVAAEAVCAGIATHGALTGQPLRIQTAGDITIGAAASITAGMIFGVSTTAGGIELASTLASTNFVSLVGVGKASNKIQIRRNNTGVAVA